MSGSLNRVELIGNLGRDPEVRHLNDGSPVVKFSVATSDSWTDKGTGERRDRTQWHNVVVYGEGLCKVAQQYLKKGNKVYVAGSVETRKYTDQGNVERSITEVILRPFNGTMVLLTPRQDGGEPAAKPAARDELDDEIPF